jgi:hypothetical protein
MYHRISKNVSAWAEAPEVVLRTFLGTTEDWGLKHLQGRRNATEGQCPSGRVSEVQRLAQFRELWEKIHERENNARQGLPKIIDALESRFWEQEFRVTCSLCGAS